MARFNVLRARRRAARSPTHIAADHRAHRAADRERQGLRRRRRRLLRGRARSRRTASSRARRSTSCEPARASRSTSARRAAARLRAVEGGQAGRAVVGLAVGQGPPGLAHRVLGDDGHAPRRDVRPPRRRQGPDLPAPRERDRAVAGRRRRRHVRALLAAQRLPQLRRREDVASRSATSSTAIRSPRRSAARRCATSASRTTTARRSTSRSRSIATTAASIGAASSQPRGGRPRLARLLHDARSALDAVRRRQRRRRRRGRARGREARARERARRSPTTSTRRSSSPRCTTPPTLANKLLDEAKGIDKQRAPAHARAARRATCAPSAARSACSRQEPAHATCAERRARLVKREDIDVAAVEQLHRRAQGRARREGLRARRRDPRRAGGDGRRDHRHAGAAPTGASRRRGADMADRAAKVTSSRLRAR